MAWMLDPRLRTAANACVLALLEREPSLSAHDDLAQILSRSARGLAGVRSYCPDPAGYAFVALHDRADRIFALAFGQSTLAFRLGAQHAAQAQAAGARPCTALGPRWACFDAFAAPGFDASRWCALALAAVD